MKHLSRLLLLLVLAVLLLVAPVAAATEMITNGNFDGSLSGWTVESSVHSGSDYSSSIQYRVNNGNGYADFYARTSTSSAVSQIMSQSLQWEGVQTLTFTVNFGSATAAAASRLVVLIDDVAIASYNTYNLAGTKSIDVSSYTGYKSLQFQVLCAGTNNVAFGIDSVSAINLNTAPTLNSISAAPSTQNVNQPVSFTAIYTAGYPVNTGFYWTYGDGAVEITTATPTHTYTNPGTYTVTCVAQNGVGSSTTRTTTVTILPAKPVVSFSASPTSGSAPLSVQFLSEIVGSDITSIEWNFGDSTSTGTNYNPLHIYNGNGQYTVTLTVTGGGGTTTVTKPNFITVANQYVRWDKATYDAGDTAVVSWNLLNFDTGKTNQIRIYSVDQYGQLATLITTIPITSSSGTTNVATANLAGNYQAVWFENGVATSLYGTAAVAGQAVLTVHITNNGAVWTDETNVTVVSGATQEPIATETTTTGTVTFNLVSGTYTVTASSSGKSNVSTTLTLTDSKTITLDWVRGETSAPSGSGSAYASSFVTFRTLDKTTGMPVVGATVTAVGKQSTNPIEWLQQLFGGTWGQEIVDTSLAGTTDSTGAITFAMFPGVRYELTITHANLPQPDSRAFTPSTLSSEYPIYLDILHPPIQDPIAMIFTSASVTSSGTITASYNDTSLTTSTLLIVISEKLPDGNYTTVDSREGIGSTITTTIDLTNYAGKDYRIQFIAQTSAFGEIVRTYYHSFPGPVVDMGWPPGWYAWACIAAGIAIAGIGRFVSSSSLCLAVCFVEWMLWFFGWMFEFDNARAAVALTLATVLSVAYYIAARR